MLAPDDDDPVAAVSDAPVEVDGIATAGLSGAGTGMDPLLPSVPAPAARRRPRAGVRAPRTP